MKLRRAPCEDVPCERAAAVDEQRLAAAVHPEAQHARIADHGSRGLRRGRHQERAYEGRAENGNTSEHGRDANARAGRRCYS